ncbi:MAG: ArsR/SmtB family transcription factor [Acidimicrobiia bacterium]
MILHPDGGSQSDPNVKRDLYDGFAIAGRALASGRRVELLDLLAQRARSVDELAAAAGMETANTSQHLQVLRNAGLVVARRRGKRVYYRLASEAVLDLLDTLRTVAHDHSAEVRALAEEYLGGEVEPITREALLVRLEAGTVTVLDVRPRSEYEAGHLPGARSVPIEELRERLGELVEEDEVVAYCRGRFCAYAHQAVRLLKEGGVVARRLEDGVPQWAATGLPLDRQEARWT